MVVWQISFRVVTGALVGLAALDVAVSDGVRRQERGRNRQQAGAGRRCWDLVSRRHTSVSWSRGEYCRRARRPLVNVP